jgi:thiosulfate/3-mercaptopyruvate sulfurtransferase
MKNQVGIHIAIAAAFFCAMSPCMTAQSHATSGAAGAAFFMYQVSSIPAAELIQPGELVKLLQATTGEKPIIIQVGSHVLYEEAHIPGSEYIGPASSSAGLEKLRQSLQSLPRKKSIILYCGCCPWSHCPNVKPAWDLVRSLGFSNVKVLYIADNFGADWVDKGYPTAKGE